MSTLTGNDVRGLMEAYQAVYAPQELTEEQVWEEVEEWVNTLIEEGYDLSDYTWEEMYESYINESPNLKEFFGPGMEKAVKVKGSGTAAQLQQRSRNVQDRGGWGGQAYRAINRAFGAKEPSWDKADRDDRRREQTALNRSSNPNWKPGGSGAGDGDGGGNRGRGDNKLEAPKPAPKPTPAPTPSRPSSSTTASTAEKIKGGMDVYNKQRSSGDFKGATETGKSVWAAANPKLAAAAAERARTRGTSQSDNPLMRGMPGKRPMTPSVQSPTLAADLGKGSGNQSLVDNPNASKSAPPKPAAPKDAPKPSPTRSGFGVSTAPLAAKLSAATSTAPPTPTAAPKAAPLPPKKETAPPPPKTPISSSYEYDAYDLVLEYLLSQGHADTLEEANYVMLEMDAEMIGGIVDIFYK